jgi:hypothetical protein
MPGWMQGRKKNRGWLFWGPKESVLEVREKMHTMGDRSKEKERKGKERKGKERRALAGARGGARGEHATLDVFVRWKPIASKRPGVEEDARARLPPPSARGVDRACRTTFQAARRRPAFPLSIGGVRARGGGEDEEGVGWRARNAPNAEARSRRGCAARFRGVASNSNARRRHSSLVGGRQALRVTTILSPTALRSCCSRAPPPPPPPVPP